MSRSTHQIAVKGVDNTQRAFMSIQARAAATGSAIRRAVGGAIAAAGAYLSFRAVGAGVNELGKLSDIAQKTSTSVAELSRATTGLNILGVSTDAESLARSFQYMERQTGRTGLKGFYETIEEIGKIGDVSARAQAAVRAFGRSGMDFMPLINAAGESTEALQNVINAMPGVSDAAAEAGDAAADAMAIVGKSVQSIWYQALEKVIRLFAGDDESSLRGAAAKAAAWLEYYAKRAAIAWLSAWRRIKGYSEAVGASVGAFGGTIVGGGSIADAAKASADAWRDATRAMDDDISKIREPLDGLRKDLNDRLAQAEAFEISYAKAAISTNARIDADRKAREETAARRPQIRNDLIMGGSSAALKIAMRGPETLNEAKKQTGILEKIARNTEKTADNTEEQPIPTDL